MQPALSSTSRGRPRKRAESSTSPTSTRSAFISFGRPASCVPLMGPRDGRPKLYPLCRNTCSGPRLASDGIDDRVWDQLAVVNALPGGEPKPGGSSHHDVQVAPDVEYCRGLGELGAEDGVVRLGFDSSGLDSTNNGNSDDMPLVVRIVEQCFFDRVDTVLEHAFAGERQRRKREASFVVLTRLQAVDAIIGEE